MVTIVEGSILDADTDVIVNAANGQLRHGGGLARFIAAAAAPNVPSPMGGRLRFAEMTAAEYEEFKSAVLSPSESRWQVDHQSAPLLAVGAAYGTSPGLLRYRAVIHAVGPVWNGGMYCEHALLERAYISALEEARRFGAKSIAFPAISAGIFGFPIDGVARTAAAAMWNHLRYDERASFYLLSEEHVKVFTETFKAHSFEWRFSL